MKKAKSILFVIIAGILWGIISLFVTKLNSMGYTSLEISFSRVLLCSVMLLLFLLIFDRKLLIIKIKDIWMFIGTGIVSLALFSYCSFTTMLQSEVSIAVALLYTSPAFVMIFSAILFKEKITIQKTLSILLTITGCIFVSGLVGSSYKLSFKVFALGVASGICYALYSIFSRYALKKYKPLTITFYTFIFASIGSAVFVNPIVTITKFALNPISILIATLCALLCGVLPYFFYTFGLDGMDTSIAGVLVAVEPLVGCLIGLVFFKESTDIFKMIGIIAILFSIVFVNIRFKNAKN